MKKLLLLLLMLPIMGQNCEPTGPVGPVDPPIDPVDPAGPYVHVVPADVGVSLGVGVVAPVPTTVYTGSLKMQSNALVENVIINGCIRFVDGSTNVTLRNVIINCDNLYPIYVKNTTNFTVEYSQVNCTSSSKIIRASGSVSGITVRNNELIGCQDFFYLDGYLDGMVVEDNYLHTLVGSSSAHADGFQIGESQPTTGSITIRGNYFDPDNLIIGKTDILFATNQSQNTILIENNFFHIWGWYTLRNSGQNAPATVRNNIYSQAFKIAFTTKGIPSKAYRHWSGNPAVSNYTCNRYEDGTFIEQAYVSGTTHVTTDCPVYP